MPKPATTPTPSVADLIKGATLPERVISVVLDRALVAEFQHLEDDLAKAREESIRDKRLGSRVTETAERIEQVRERMRASTVAFTLRGMPARKWRELKAKHPVGDNPSNEDTLVGADVNGLFNEAVPASIVSPELKEADWEALLDVLTEGEWDRFTNTVYALNEEGVSIPFSRSASAALRVNDDD